MIANSQSGSEIELSQLYWPDTLIDTSIPTPATDSAFKPQSDWVIPSNDSTPKPQPVWVDPTPAKTKEQILKEKVHKALVGWPWTGVPDKLITLSPFHLNEHPSNGTLKLPRVTQTSTFFTKIFNVDDIAFEILKLVFLHHNSAWKLAATCQQAWDIVSKKVDIWDMTSGFFNLCEHPTTNDSETKKQAIPGSVSAHLVVTPFKRPEGQATYAEQVKNLQKLSLAVLNFSDSLRNVHFHRIPFLNINLLALLIPQMRHVEILGIYNCRLMHLGTTLKLLDLLKVDRLKGRENQIALDFFPNYHLGPEDSDYYSGTYGVCWDNLNLDICLGIWSLVKRIVTKARQQKIDFESPHTLFRQWLEKSPCWNVGPTLNSFFYPGAEPIEIASMVEYRKTHGRPDKFKTMQKYRDNIGWWTSEYICGTCGDKQMGVFFFKNEVHWLRNDGLPMLPECYGCRLTYELRRETDHYKTEKRRIIKAWLRDDDGWNTTDLRKAIEDFDLHGIENMAKELDELHHMDMTQGPDPYDRETQERQIPYNYDELKGCRGAFRRSPEVCQEKNRERAYFGPREEHCWYYEALDRYDGHGLHY